MNMVINIIIAVVMFCVLILIHELGHFLTAKWMGVKVNEFSIGMGPKLLQKKGRETQYTIRLFPIGGYVSMEGEDEESEDENAFNKKSVYKRMLIVSAGAVMNLLLGLIIVFSMVLSTQNLASTTVGGFVDGAVSNQSLQTGDKILKIDNYRILIAQDLSFGVLRQMGTNPVDVVVERDGEKITIPDVQFKTVNENGKNIFVQDFLVKKDDKNFFTVMKHTFLETFSLVRMVWNSLIMLITGKAGFDQISGPVGITKAIGDAVQYGFMNLLFLIALITINLGVFNMLPFPALDGGRLLFMIVEAIRKKPVSQKVESAVHMVGFALLMLLTVLVLFNDIVRLIQ